MADIDFESSAAMAAFSVVTLLRDRDFTDVWPHLDRDLRLSFVQLWITDNPQVMSDPLAPSSREALAEALAVEEPTHDLWPHFVWFAHRRLYAALLGEIGDRELGAGTNPRPLSPELEVIRLFALDDLPVDASGNRYLPAGESRRALTLTMRLRQGRWTVAGWGDAVASPGWPPRFPAMISPED